MVRQNERSTGLRPAAAGAATESASVDAFLSEARRVAATPKGRLIFALDATMSRQPTWDMACALQADMFEEAAAIGGLAVQLVYFRGAAECRASRFVNDPRRLADMMATIDCRGGHTQIARVLLHVRDAAAEAPVSAFVLVGDAMEEPIDDLCVLAGELGLKGVKGFFFHEGLDTVAETGFREMARLTGGAYAQFSPGAAMQLRALLRAAAAYAAGGSAAVRRLVRAGAAPEALLTQLR
jgi:hypothetical protein